MKDIWLTVLRDRNSSLKDFREATSKLAMDIAFDSGTFLERNSQTVFTPFQETLGFELSNPVLVPILRSGLAMLPAFLQVYPSSIVGFLGMKRNERTFEPSLYYENLPSFEKDQMVFILDPMIATGHSAKLAIELILEKGVEITSIVLIAILASTESIAYLSAHFPSLRISVAAVDPHLNSSKCIVPGLGDFGDRYFGV